ncbi:helicase-related protein [Tropicimonas sp. IMCC34011]|uniref:helicase-related protein n=1 Tax=Tropicimonas sp. IMCC34011 TaxID=2248759 RepID=UPI000E243F32|nr:helicase-related protein [Tropicimonas sp. IMCC34011]
MHDRPSVTAVLGPTNTGKTHYAIERMLGHRTGIIGLPLRLLAREVYDRIVAIRGPRVVALVTGEERIVPPKAQYWVCTVEAMPEGTGCDFLAIDEIQLCADPERGHVFTDRLLRARGLHETLFLGSDSMRSVIAALVPRVQFMRRERFSELIYAGPKKISRMPPRSAIVAFSAESVYAIAELIRRQKGGCAVVMGALSPRTRNAQVDLYQNGDVDYLVATDAIGMGLNLDVRHVAFAGLSKFDGRRMRPLAPNELGQIAGRAGRYTQDGSFGTTGEAPPIDDEVASAIMDHRFSPVKKLLWRNHDLDFGSPQRLEASLERPAEGDLLQRTRESDDLAALRALMGMPEVIDAVRDARDVRLLWDVCRIPDFRGISAAEHASLLGRIFGFLREWGRVPDDWLARQVKRIDRTDGDIDALGKRLAYIRTWTYVAQRSGWVDDERRWRDETRAVEDRLSDALHQALTQRFVDRRTSVLLRRLKQREGLVAEVSETGEVTVEGEHVGRLDGFRFSQDKSGDPDGAKTVRQAALAALKPEFSLRADRLYNAPDTEFDFTEQGGLMWGSSAIGKLVKGSDALKPRVEVFVDDEAGEGVAEKVARRLDHFIGRKIAALFEPLLGLSSDEALTGLARGFAFRMVEGMGLLERGAVAEEVRSLDQEARGALRKHGLRFGQFTIFMPLLLKPAPTRLRLVLWSLWNNLQEFPESPPPGLVTIPTPKDAPDGYALMAGYRVAGERSIRIDMLERLADQLRPMDSRGGFEATADMLSITGLTLEQFAALMDGLGYRAEKGEREKMRAPAAPSAPAKTDEAQAESASEAGASEAEAVPSAETEASAPLPGEAEPVSEAETPAPSEAAAPEAPVEPTAEGASEVEAVPSAEPAAQEPSPAEGTSEAEAPAPEASPADTDAAPAESAPQPTGETEIFYTFTWAGRRGGQQSRRGGGQAQRKGGGKPRAEAGGRGKPGGKGPRGGKKDGKSGNAPRAFEARPPKKDKPIDPDNPFAALAALKDKR